MTISESTCFGCGSAAEYRDRINGRYACTPCLLGAYGHIRANVDIPLGKDTDARTPPAERPDFETAYRKAALLIATTPDCKGITTPGDILALAKAIFDSRGDR